ncbi:MAG: hypothetical protein J4F40_20225, partial [Alphaproteobacteria bacterium]|nr:hypothetical protein [Alphaproteobacteria bacterium]
MAEREDVTRIRSIEDLGEVSPGYVYVGSGVFEPTLVMPDCGPEVYVEDWGVTLYRGPQAAPELRVYGFTPEIVAPGALRKINLMAALGGALAPFGAGPNRPYPFLNEHPYFQARPVTADILFQFDNRRAEWSQAKGLTDAGAKWLAER